VSNSVWLRILKVGGQGPIWAVEPLDGWNALHILDRSLLGCDETSHYHSLTPKHKIVLK
jgi:hypothetical protein